MKRLRAMFPVACLGLAVAAGPRSVQADDGIVGVPNPAQAHVDYMLKCQGCHQPEGTGNPANTPPLKGEVARFLHVPEGREFLARVPGVASVDLDDARLAQLLNWTIQRFDRANVPADFEPYSAGEIGRLRTAPLRLERASARGRLVQAIEAGAQ